MALVQTNKTLLKNEAKFRKNKKLMLEKSRKISKRTVRGATRNIAAAPAEAVHLVGIGVVVAVTGWEIYDACKTMEDLAFLNQQLASADAIETEKVCGLKVHSASELLRKAKDKLSKKDE